MIVEVNMYNTTNLGPIHVADINNAGQMTRWYEGFITFQYADGKFNTLSITPPEGWAWFAGIEGGKAMPSLVASQGMAINSSGDIQP